MAVDEARHREQILGRNDLEVLPLFRDVEVRSDRGDPGAPNEDVRTRELRVVVVHGEDAGVSNQDGHGRLQ